MGNGPGGEKALEELTVRVPPRLRRVRPEPVRREEWALEVDAENARACLLARRHLTQGCDQRVLGSRDQRRLKGGDTAFEQRLAGQLVRGRVRAGEVDPAVAVHLQVDESRCGDAAARLGARPTDTIRPATISTSPRTQLAFDDRGLDTQLHRTLPPQSRSSSTGSSV